MDTVSHSSKFGNIKFKTIHYTDDYDEPFLIDNKTVLKVLCKIFKLFVNVINVPESMSYICKRTLYDRKSFTPYCDAYDSPEFDVKVKTSKSEKSWNPYERF